LLRLRLLQLFLRAPFLDCRNQISNPFADLPDIYAAAGSLLTIRAPVTSRKIGASKL
jgi:hypothetical protein